MYRSDLGRGPNNYQRTTNPSLIGRKRRANNLRGTESIKHTPKLSSPALANHWAFQSGKSIFVRSIDNPSQSKQYTGHTNATTVARFSPSGYYIASGDVSGSVRVWDCVGEGATKGDYGIIAGRINDIAWDADSQRIIAVGI